MMDQISNLVDKSPAERIEARFKRFYVGEFSVARHGAKASQSRLEPTEWNRLTSLSRAGIRLSGGKYGSTQRAKIFKYVTDNFVVDPFRVTDLIHYIYTRRVKLTTLGEYLNAAKKFMSVKHALLGLNQDDRGVQELLLTYVLNSNVSDSVDAFDQYIDEFVVKRDFAADKINVSIT